MTAAGSNRFDTIRMASGKTTVGGNPRGHRVASGGRYLWTTSPGVRALACGGTEISIGASGRRTPQACNAELSQSADASPHLRWAAHHWLWIGSSPVVTA
jgi:hypothetical protein